MRVMMMVSQARQFKMDMAIENQNILHYELLCAKGNH